MIKGFYQQFREKSHFIVYRDGIIQTVNSDASCVE